MLLDFQENINSYSIKLATKSNIYNKYKTYIYKYINLIFMTETLIYLFIYY